MSLCYIFCVSSILDSTFEFPILLRLLLELVSLHVVEYVIQFCLHTVRQKITLTRVQNNMDQPVCKLQVCKSVLIEFVQ